MPTTEIVIYQERDNVVPLIDWLDDTHIHNQESRRKCLLAVERLHELGFELKRPEADYLEEGIYELRISYRHRNFRILYGFVAQNVVLLTHGITKERRVPPKEIQQALDRKRKYEDDPDAHTYKGN